MIPDTVNLVVTLKEYLARLETSPGGKHVPTLKELAADIGVSEKHFLRIVNNQTRDISRKMAAVIAALRQRGFDADVSDVLRYVD